MTEREPLVNGGDVNEDDTYQDLELQREYEDLKAARITLHGFIRKVLGIVALQVCLTTAVGAYFTLSEAAAAWIRSSGLPLLITSLVMIVVIGFVMGCFPVVIQSYPMNLVTLFLYTIFMSIGFGALSALAHSKSGGPVVLEALICTSVVAIGLTAFAFQTKYDLLSWAGAVNVVVSVLIACGLLRLFFPDYPRREVVYAAAMALILVVYMTSDAIALLGTDSTQLSEDQYITAVLMLYIPPFLRTSPGILAAKENTEAAK